MPDVQISNPAQVFSGVSGRLSVNNMRPFIGNDGQTYVVNNGQAQLHTNNGLLMYDEWKDLDRNVVEVATDRLVGIADLQARGLTHNLGSIGKTISQWEEVSDMDDADVSMSGVTAGGEDTTAYDQASVPVPIIHKDFRLEVRRLEASRIFGESLDVTTATTASRKVSEKSEDILFAGDPTTVSGNTIYGYTNYPNRSTVDMTTAWDDVASSDNSPIVDETNEALQALRNQNHYGPFIMYIPGEYESKLDEDFQEGTGDTRTLRQRLLALSGLEEIKVADRLDPDNVVIVQMTRDVVDLAIAQDVTTVQWNSQGGMSEHFKVMAVWVPRLKSDYDDKTGIAHIRPSGS